MPGDSTSDKKKKKKKRTEDEEHNSKGALDTLHEDGKEKHSDEDSGGEDDQSRRKDLDNDEQEQVIDKVMQFIQDLHDQFSESFQIIDTRLNALEVPKNLNSSGSFKTPKNKNKDKDKSKKKERKSQKKLSVLDSIARSSVKQDWRTLHKRVAQDVQDDDDDEDDDESSSSSESDKSNFSSLSDDEDSHGNWAKAVNNSGKNPKDNKQLTLPKGKLFQNLHASEQAAAKTIVTVTRTEKDCNVRINDFSLANVCSAMKKIMEFQDREGTVVKMTKVLSPACKQHLRLKYNIKTGELAEMGMSKLFSIIAKETQIHSVSQFYSCLKEALTHIKLMDWHKVNPLNHETYYFQQLNLVDDFMMVFKIMILENKDVCPKIDTKDNGLLHLFKSFHAHHYWKHTWSGMKQKYTNIQTFMDEYLDIALEQYQCSLVFKEMPYVYSGYSRSDDKVNSYYDKKREYSRNLNNSKYKSKDHSNSNILHNLYEDEHNSSEGSDNDTWRNANAVGTHKQASQPRYKSEDEDSISIASNDTREEDTEDESPDSDLAAFANHENNQKLDKKNLACTRKLYTGKCDNLDCPYGHRPDILLRGAQESRAKLDAYIESHKDTAKIQDTSVPYKILHKEKFGKA